MKNKAQKIVVKICSSEGSSEDEMEKLKEELRNERFLPAKGKTFKIQDCELLLVDVDPEDARFAESETKVELLKESSSKEKIEGDKEMKDVSIYDLLIPELLGDQQKAILDVLSKKLDGKDIPAPPIIFLHGPPSTSKTEILKAVGKKAKSKGWEVKSLSGPRLNRVYLGELANEIKKIKEEVSDKFVLLIDEVDIICAERNLGKGNSTAHQLEAVTSLNKLLDKIIQKEGIAVLTSNAEKNLIDEAILNRCLNIRREKPKKKKVERFIEISADEFKLGESEVKEIKKLELRDFREAKKIMRLRACGIDLEKALLFAQGEKEKRRKYIG